MKKIVIFLIVLMMVSVGLLSGCTDINVPEIPDELTEKMTIITFTVIPSLIEVGDTANLSWIVTGSDTLVTIDNGIGEVSLTGNRIITPTETTTYKLTATNNTSTKNVTTQIIVIMNNPEENNSVNNPDIAFTKSSNILTVSRTDEGLKWDDFTITGECDKSALGGYIIAGDTITSCSGIITIIHNPTNSLIGSWTFVNEEPIKTPDMAFNKQYTPIKGIRIIRADTWVKWDDLHIDGGTKPMFTSITVVAGEFISLNTTDSTITIVYTPTNTLMGAWTFV